MPLAVSLGNGHPNLTEIMSKDAESKTGKCRFNRCTRP